MKVIVTVCIILIALILSNETKAAGGTMSGSGTSGSPLLVEDYDDLKAIGTGSYTLASEYRLTADIDASASLSENSGAGFIPIGTQASPFTGKIHGGGFDIDGITINRNINYVGLIGYASGAYIDSLGVVNCSVIGVYYVGALIGRKVSGEVSSCNSSGTINCNAYGGGLIGYNLEAGTVTKSYSSCDVVATTGYGGGLIGVNLSSVSNCYAQGDVSGGSVLGGFTGGNGVEVISNCYSTGNISGTSIGGFANTNSLISEGTITNCFWDTESSRVTSSAGATGLTTSAMKSYSSTESVGWDYQAESTNGSDNIWGIDESGVDNGGYPFLSIQGLNHRVKATVTSQAASQISSSTAVGNGTIQFLGVPNPTAHGVCWSTTANPDLNDSFTDEGPAIATGAFTSNITSLLSGTTYYVRAYATNSVGTVYGDDVSFTTSSNMLLHYNTNLSEGTTIEIPLYGTVDVTVDWGDGGLPETIGTEGNHSHTYTSEGEYDVTIGGSFNHFGAYTVVGIDKLVRVDSWPGAGLTSLEYAFRGASNLTTVPTTLPSTVSNLYGCFAYATSFNQDISGWDVSAVVDMGSMFFGASLFNQNIGSWDVSSAQLMSYMFRSAGNFNQDISSWNVASVIAMNNMFEGASNFNQDIGSWDVSSDTTMSGMFMYASNFDQDLGEWDVSNVKHMDDMFSFATLSADNYDSLLIGWSELSLQDNVTLDAPNCFYNTDAQVSRQNIISTYSWTINDKGTTTPIVNTQDVSDITSTTATANWDITQLGISNPTAHGVCWSTSALPSTSDDTINIGTATSTGSFTGNLSSLSSGTTYHVRAYATNSAGTVYGDDVSFTTLSGGVVPDNNQVSGTTVTNGNSECFNALYTVTVAGDATVVEVESGADAIFIAGQNIRFLPGFHANSGSYVNAYITETSSFCNDLPASIVAAEPIAEKSLPVFDDFIEDSQSLDPQRLKVFPNPNNGVFTVELTNFNNEVHLTVFNAVGAMVHQLKTVNENINFDLSNTQRGVYFVKAISGDKQLVKKIMVQ